MAGTILGMIAVVTGGAFVYSAPGKMHKAAQGYDETIVLARRIVMIVRNVCGTAPFVSREACVPPRRACSSRR